MKNNNTIKIKNELPELLEAVCNHKDCAEWLKDAIWDAVGNQSQLTTFTAVHWRAQLEAIETAAKREPELKTVNLAVDVSDAEVLR